MFYSVLNRAGFETSIGNWGRKSLAMSISCVLGLPLLVTAPVQAAATLEEVVVTARKREESLQDVPVAVQAVTGDFIAEKGIIDVQALAPYTPNFSYATAVGASDLLLMRGAGSIGSGPQFEPSVGQVFDGYFISRSRLGRTAFLDLAQVEVLKGPQGAIIGKNTSLGAINITPKKPTEEFEASVSLGHAWEDQEGPEASGFVSGALTDSVRARLALEYKDHDGNVDNTAPLAASDTAATNDSLAGRLIVQADLTESLTSELLLQTADITREGKPRDIIWCPSSKVDALAAVGVNCGRDQTTAAVTYAPNGVDVIDDELTIETNVVGVRFDWELDNFTVTSLTGYSDYEISDQFDSDQSPLNFQSFTNDEQYDQFTQEFRIAGDGETASYIAGLFYMENEMDFEQLTFRPGSNWRRNQLGVVETETVSAFGQVDWSMSDDYKLTVGLRWTSEDRDGEYIQFPTEAFTDTAIPCAGGPRACTKLDPADNFPSAFVDEISEDKVSGNVSFQRLLENGMLYISYANGTKSSGFGVTTAQTPDAFIFDGEETDSYELGGKHELLDNSLRFNWAVYYMEVDGLQVSALDPLLTIPVNNVVNADVISQGVEVDVTWAATEALTLTWSAGYTDATFDGLMANCYNGQTVGCVGGLQDLDNAALPLTPDLSSVLGADYHWDLGEGLELRASAKWLHSSDYSTQMDHHPEATQDAADKFDISLVLSGDHGQNTWKAALVGKNLTDEITYQFGATPPNVGGIGGPRVMNAFPELGRVISAKFTYSWF